MSVPVGLFQVFAGVFCGLVAGLNVESGSYGVTGLLAALSLINLLLAAKKL